MSCLLLCLACFSAGPFPAACLAFVAILCPTDHPPLPLPLPEQVYVSYGGLLMQLTGDPKRLEDLDIDQNIYLLMRKV